MTALDANGDTKLEAALRLILVAYGITGWVREYRFSRPDRAGSVAAGVSTMSAIIVLLAVLLLFMLAAVATWLTS